MPEGTVQAVAGFGTVLVLLAVLCIGVTWNRVIRRGRPTAPGTADVMLVFGAETYPDGRPCPELRARLAHAAALYARGCAGIVVCSGGHAGPCSEPRVMRAALVRLGVPQEAILIDEWGISTRRSIAGVRRLGAKRWRRTLLVSSPYHMHRIVSEARRQGLAQVASAAPSTPVMRRFGPRNRQRAREVAAIWWYALTAELHRPAALRPRSRSRRALPPLGDGQPAARRLG